MSGFPLGGGRINPAPCNDEDWDEFAQQVAVTINDGGAGTDEKFAAINGSTPGYWSEIVVGEATYVEGTHTQVFWERSGSTIMLFSIAGGGGGGSSYTDPAAADVTHVPGDHVGHGQIVITWT